MYIHTQNYHTYSELSEPLHVFRYPSTIAPKAILGWFFQFKANAMFKGSLFSAFSVWNTLFFPSYTLHLTLNLCLSPRSPFSLSHSSIHHSGMWVSARSLGQRFYIRTSKNNRTWERSLASITFPKLHCWSIRLNAIPALTKGLHAIDCFPNTPSHVQ